MFPGAPAGILYPGDPEVPRTLAPPGNLDFAPRVGLAYSLNVPTNSLLGKIFGEPGNTSIRAGYGIYYEAIEALSIGILAGNAPFGITYSSPSPPLFATPFITASSGQYQGQPFPATLATGKLPAVIRIPISTGLSTNRLAAFPDMPRRTVSRMSTNICFRLSGNWGRKPC